MGIGHKTDFAFHLDTSSHKLILFSSGTHILKASLPPNRVKRFTDLNLDKYFNSLINIQTSFANTQILIFIFVICIYLRYAVYYSEIDAFDNVKMISFRNQMKHTAFEKLLTQEYFDQMRKSVL